MSRIVTKGATSQTVYVEVLDSTSTTGGRKTGLAYNTSSLTAYYVRNGGSATAITLATLAAANSAWSSGGFKEVDSTNMPGIYRLDVPDAALAAGSGDSVAITLKGATGMAQVSAEIQLVAVNLQDAVRAGMTALPNAAAEAAGGLYTRGTGAGQINQPANGMVDANVVRNAGTAITAAAGIQEVKVASIAAAAITATSIASDAITDAKVASDVTIASVTGAVGSVTGNVGGNVVGSVASVTAGVTLAASAVQAIWDALTSALTTVGSIGKLLVDNIDAAISSRLATASYTAPLDAAGTRTAVGLASANLDTQIATLATAAALTVVDDFLDTEVAAIKAKIGDSEKLNAAFRARKSAAATIETMRKA